MLLITPPCASSLRLKGVYRFRGDSLKALSIAGLILSAKTSYAKTLRRENSCAVIGIGGFGCRLAASLESTPEFSAAAFTYIDTDANMLKSVSNSSNSSLSRIRHIHLRTPTLQSYSFDSVLTDNITYRKSAIESVHKLERSIRGIDLVVIITGLGGRTGSSVAPGVAKLARSAGKTCLILAGTPFAFEGVRCTVASQGLMELREHASKVLTFSNESAIDALGKDATLADASNYIHHRVLYTARQLLQPGFANRS